jgi:hypothetical protein
LQAAKLTPQDNDEGNKSSSNKGTGTTESGEEKKRIELGKQFLTPAGKCMNREQ